MNYKPLNENILLEREKVKNTTSSGIFIPESVVERENIGKVINISEKVEKKNEIKVGDIVVFKQNSKVEVKLEGKEYLVVKYEDILLKKEG
jgi:chaperonin GroES